MLLKLFGKQEVNLNQLSQIENVEQRGARIRDLADQCGVLELVDMDLLRPVLPDDIGDQIEPRAIDEEARIDAGWIGDNAQPEAGGPTSIRHGFAHIDDLHAP